VAAAPPPEQVLAQVIDFVGDSAVVAHSGTFDLSFLIDGQTGPGYELFDTLDLARIMLPMAPSHSLPHLSRQLGLTHADPHRALSDADAARQLFRYLWRFARGVPRDLFDRMLEVVAGWPHPLQHFLSEAYAAGPNGTNSLATTVAAPGVPARDTAPSTDPLAIRALLGPDGPMAGRLDDYELRESQLQMTLAIAQLYGRGGRLLVEAGPGTGKSLAYLVPAVHHAVATGERVVVATNTITLQEQLFSKDIPFMRSWLPFDFKASLLKGRANYVSLRRWNRYLNAPSRRADGSWFDDEVKFKLRMLVWLAQSQQGDRSEIKLNGFDELFWLRAASTPDDCLAGHCENFKAQRCFYWNSRWAAQDADVIVTNHALLLADALKGGSVLPPHEHLVVDEAHQLEETAVEALTMRAGEGELLESIDGALTWFRAAVGTPSEAARRAAADCRQAVVELFREIRAVISARQPEIPTRPSREEPVIIDAANRALPDIVVSRRSPPHSMTGPRRCGELWMMRVRSYRWRRIPTPSENWISSSPSCRAGWTLCCTRCFSRVRNGSTGSERSAVPGGRSSRRPLPRPAGSCRSAPLPARKPSSSPRRRWPSPIPSPTSNAGWGSRR